MLPKDNACSLSPERNYAFSYGDARFFMIDATGDIEKIACGWKKNSDRPKRNGK
jgi:hypothetical protein